MNIDIKNILASGERVTLECKKAQHSVPNSLWDTYSAFANTYGGTILLGVVEHTEDKDNVIEDVIDNVIEKLSERQRIIYDILKTDVRDNVRDNVNETTETLARKLSVSSRTIRRDLDKMKSLGIVKREGGDYGGKWVVITS